MLTDSLLLNLKIRLFQRKIQSSHHQPTWFRKWRKGWKSFCANLTKLSIAPY